MVNELLLDKKKLASQEKEYSALTYIFIFQYGILSRN